MNHTLSQDELETFLNRRLDYEYRPKVYYTIVDTTLCYGFYVIYVYAELVEDISAHVLNRLSDVA